MRGPIRGRKHLIPIEKRRASTPLLRVFAFKTPRPPASSSSYPAAFPRNCPRSSTRVMASASSGSSTTAIAIPMASGMANQPTSGCWCYKGAARLEFEDRMVDMSPGDYISNPAHQKHRVAWTSPDEVTIWLAVFYDRTR
jgi:hypothetical protein